MRKCKERRGRRESNGGDEPNWGTLHTYMEMLQQTLCTTNTY
jgi:hypothetical protein